MDKMIRNLSPLTEASFYVLLAFNKPNHGYGVIKDVSTMTNERLKLAPGTLYGVITSFLKNKIIELDSIEGSKKKKTYRITSIGRELLDYEISRVEELLQNVREVL